MNIQAQNDFIYLNNVYPQPYFLVNYYPISDTYSIPVNCFMFENKTAFENGNSYLQSFGSDVSYDIIYDDILVTNEVINLLQSISPNTIFVKV
jgi:hypothetical protein